MTQVQTRTVKHLLGLKGMSAQELTSILDRAAFWEQYPAKETHFLQGTFIANMFFENSTAPGFPSSSPRSGWAPRCSILRGGVRVQKGESIYDTVRTLESMASTPG